MEFWGTEVAPGDPKVCQPGDEMYCHVSQAALGPSTGGKSERVVLRVETGGKDVVLGTLSTGKCDQMALDLIFDREFKLSHTGSSCSVYFCGYKTEKGEPEEFDSEEDEDEEESEEEEAPDAVPMKANGDAKPISGGKALADAVKKTVKSPVKPQLVDDEAEEGEDSDEDDDDDEVRITVSLFPGDNRRHYTLVEGSNDWGLCTGRASDAVKVTTGVLHDLHRVVMCQSPDVSSVFFWKVDVSKGAIKCGVLTSWDENED